MDVGAAFDEAGVDHQLAVQRDIGRDALDHHFRQRDLHAADRLFARGAVSDDLADHRIVVRRYIVTGIGVRINADAGAARRVPGGDAARDGVNLNASSALMRHSMAWPASITSRWRK